MSSRERNTENLNEMSLEIQGNKPLIMHMNIRSLPNHCDEFPPLTRVFNNDRNLSIRTWMKPIEETCSFQIPGYHKPLNVAKTKKLSGIFVCIAEQFSCNIIHIQTSLENFELLAYMLKLILLSMILHP